jgi:hypothetical protein
VDPGLPGGLEEGGGTFSPLFALMKPLTGADGLTDLVSLPVALLFVVGVVILPEGWGAFTALALKPTPGVFSADVAMRRKRI